MFVWKSEAASRFNAQPLPVGVDFIVKSILSVSVLLYIFICTCFPVGIISTFI